MGRATVECCKLRKTSCVFYKTFKRYMSMCNIFFHTARVFLYGSVVVSSLHMLFSMISIAPRVAICSNWGDRICSFQNENKMS